MGVDGGERKILSARVVRTIQSIKEIVKDHSDADIYVALQETNMDPNETAQKLLNQDPFHEVRRKKDKKKDVRLSQNTGYRSSIESKRPIERVEQNIVSNQVDQGLPRGGYNHNVVAGRAKKPIERVEQNVVSSPIDRGLPRGGYNRNVVAVRREFRVVRDRRNKDVNGEVKPTSPTNSTSVGELKSLQLSEKGSNVVNQKSSSVKHSPPQASAVQPASHTIVSHAQGPKLHDPDLSSVLISTHSVVGVYSSSSDPVHFPSPDSRSAANIGAIKRELGAVGVHRQISRNSSTPSSVQNNSIPTPHLVKDRASSRESPKSFYANSASDQLNRTSQPESILPSVSGSRPSSSNRRSRPHQQVAGNQKASQPAREWKRKSDPKAKANDVGVIGSPAKSVSHPIDNSKNLEIDAAQVYDKLARVDIRENQNVFIAENIRVSDSDRSRLTFGSFGTDVDSSQTTEPEPLTVRAGENVTTGVSVSLPTSIPKLPTSESSASKHVDSVNNQARNSGSNSPASGGSSENQLPDKNRHSSPQNLDNYAEIGMVHGNSTFTHTESQQQQDPAELTSLPVYDPQTGYDMPYYRSSIDEPIRAQGVGSPHEALGSHMSNNNMAPVSSISMVQQQQQPMPQMYQQLHVSPFTNMMPYRQIISPVYGPPIPMTGYSGNPTYPHPSNGNSFLLMPGGSSHTGANNVKYGIQQFKPVPGGNPTGFGNFVSPTGYAFNTPGGVGGATGLEESSRLKYKDSNLYVPNPQGETSEMWMSNPREVPNLQSAASYYNMGGQMPHGAYTPLNVGAQSSHMQFPGIYHPPPSQANLHHLGSTMGASAASAAQLSAYQQPQMSHLNWNTNF